VDLGLKAALQHATLRTVELSIVVSMVFPAINPEHEPGNTFTELLVHAPLLSGRIKATAEHVSNPLYVI